MADHDTTQAPRTKVARAMAQRDRILNAAQQCFIEHGFHAAGMAAIAQKAGMSPGLIYRYFDGKDAIILAIIDRQLDDKRRNIALLGTGDDLAQRVRDLFAAWRRGDDTVMNAALFLEMTAHASRHPSVAHALADADRTSSADFRAWMAKRAEASGADVDAREIQLRTLILQSFIEGLAIRALREPDFDAELVAAAVNRMLPMLTSFEG